jgi:hypothetical protein
MASQECADVAVLDVPGRITLAPLLDEILQGPFRDNDDGVASRQR